MKHESKMNRRDFVYRSGLLGFGAMALPHSLLARTDYRHLGKLTPVGRALETEGYYVWCSCPVAGPDGKMHLFYSRWKAEKKMGGWIRGSEIAHAVADRPEGPYEHLRVVLAPRGEGHWDATTCHNPLVKLVDGTWCLFFMGNRNGRTDTKRIGLATAPSIYGPWTRPDAPLLEAGAPGSWDDHCTTNPAFVKRDGRFWLYYKSWNTAAYESAGGPIRGNRKYGLAIADKLEGPYLRHAANPVIDFSNEGGNRQFEDAFIWQQGGRLRIICRDMGFYNHEDGLLMHSKNGLDWSSPAIAYEALTKYVDMPPAPGHLRKYGRLERPMLLLNGERPEYLFGAAQGGKFQTSSTYIFKVG